MKVFQQDLGEVTQILPMLWCVSLRVVSSLVLFLCLRRRLQGGEPAWVRRGEEETRFGVNKFEGWGSGAQKGWAESVWRSQRRLQVMHCRGLETKELDSWMKWSSCTEDWFFWFFFFVCLNTDQIKTKHTQHTVFVHTHTHTHTLKHTEDASWSPAGERWKGNVEDWWVKVPV